MCSPDSVAVFGVTVYFYSVGVSLKFGRYETTRVIARGGMATVYLGRAVAEGGFERLVAIKVMHPHIAEQPEFEAMFLDEARLAASIRHPNVVATVDVSKTDGEMFLVMDYVDGPALNKILRQLKKHDLRIPIEITLRILIDTLNGLEAAHTLKDANGNSLNLVHRDVSPQNILVGGDGIARLTDFGVARAEARLSMTTGGEIKGKLGYMPPEQSKGEAIDCRADVYAAGVVLWECLTHERMFAADNAGELIFKVLQGVQKAPQELNPAVPYHLDRVCMSALSLEVENRYQSAADFAEALEEAALHDGVSVATARQLARFVEAHRSITDGTSEPENRIADFSSVAAPTTDSSGNEMDSGTGRPHSVSVKIADPAHGRMVTALAAVIAMIVGVGAAGVLMLREPATTERAKAGLTPPTTKNAQAALTVLEAVVANEEAARAAAADAAKTPTPTQFPTGPAHTPGAQPSVPDATDPQDVPATNGEGGAAPNSDPPPPKDSSTPKAKPAPPYIPPPKPPRRRRKKGQYRPDGL